MVYLYEAMPCLRAVAKRAQVNHQEKWPLLHSRCYVCPSESTRVIDEKESVLLPMVEAATTECSVKRTQLQCVPSESASANPKKSRQGGGTHGLTIVRQLLLDREN